jgi:hypothetical protein
MREIETGKASSDLDFFFPEQKNYVSALKIILEDESHHLRRRLLAAKLLGEMQQGDIINILVANLGVRSEASKKISELNEDTFPVGFALISEGNFVRSQLLSIIKIAHDEEMLRLCTFVLMKIEDRDVAEFILEREIKKETVVSQKENLEKALDALNSNLK